MPKKKTHRALRNTAQTPNKQPPQLIELARLEVTRRRLVRELVELDRASRLILREIELFAIDVPRKGADPVRVGRRMF
jgi:hypothetical protein